MSILKLFDVKETVEKIESIVEGDLFDNTVKSLCEIKFDSSDDFQHFFDISRQLVKMIMVDLGSEASERTSENNFMSNDLLDRLIFIVVFWLRFIKGRWV